MPTKREVIARREQKAEKSQQREMSIRGTPSALVFDLVKEKWRDKMVRRINHDGPVPVDVDYSEASRYGIQAGKYFLRLTDESPEDHWLDSGCNPYSDPKYKNALDLIFRKRIAEAYNDPNSHLRSDLEKKYTIGDITKKILGPEYFRGTQDERASEQADNRPAKIKRPARSKSPRILN